jgi:hypothetical protein
MNRMNLKFFKGLSKPIIWLIFICTTSSLYSQTAGSKATDAYQDLMLNSIRPEAEISSAIENHLVEINQVINNTNTPNYDKSLFKVYALMVKEIKDSASSEGLSVIGASFNKILNQISTNSEYKEVKMEDLRTLSYGLLEILQILPQVNYPTID